MDNLDGHVEREMDSLDEHVERKIDGQSRWAHGKRDKWTI